MEKAIYLLMCSKNKHCVEIFPVYFKVAFQVFLWEAILIITCDNAHRKALLLFKMCGQKPQNVSSWNLKGQIYRIALSMFSYQHDQTLFSNSRSFFKLSWHLYLMELFSCMFLISLCHAYITKKEGNQQLSLTPPSLPSILKKYKTLKRSSVS